MNFRYLLIICYLLLHYNLKAQQFLNLDFECRSEDNSMPKSWIVTEENGCDFMLDSSKAYSGRMSFLITPKQKNTVYNTSLLNELSKNLFRNKKRIEIHAFVYSRSQLDTNTMLVSRQLSAKGIEIVRPAVINIKQSSNNQWYQLLLKQDIDAATGIMALGIKITSADSLWIDKFEILIDDSLIVDLPPTVISAPTKKEEAWLNNNIIPIRSVEPPGCLADLNFLYKELAHYKVIALGEATHGSSEIYLLKHRLLRFLFEKMGFTILAMEMDMAEAETLNKYLLNSIGDPANLLLRTGNWPWETSEFLQLIKWMRHFNITHHAKLKIMGFDIAFSNTSFELVESFALNHDKKLLTYIEPIKKICNTGRGFMQDKKTLDSLISGIDSLLNYYQRDRQKISLSSSTNEYKWIGQNIKSLKQVALYFLNVENQDLSRDKSMAENANWILNNNPSAKVVLWAHNEHIKKAGNSMGEFLRKKHPFYSIGFALGKGEFTAISETGIIGSYALIPPVHDSYERYFSTGKYPVWFLNLKKILPGNEDNQWLLKSHQLRFIGIKSSRYQFIEVSLIDNFDAILFIKNASASHLLFKH